MQGLRIHSGIASDVVGRGSVVARVEGGALVTSDDDRGLQGVVQLRSGLRFFGVDVDNGRVDVGDVSFDVIAGDADVYAVVELGRLRLCGPRELRLGREGRFDALFDVVEACEDEAPRRQAWVRHDGARSTLLSVAPLVAGMSLSILLHKSRDRGRCSPEVARRIARDAAVVGEERVVGYDGRVYDGDAPGRLHAPSLFANLSGLPARAYDDVAAAEDADVAAVVRGLDPDGYALERDHREQLAILAAR